MKEDAAEWADGSLEEYMAASARRGRKQTGVTIPATDPESFLKGSAERGCSGSYTDGTRDEWCPEHSSPSLLARPPYSPFLSPMAMLSGPSPKATSVIAPARAELQLEAVATRHLDRQDRDDHLHGHTCRPHPREDPRSTHAAPAVSTAMSTTAHTVANGTPTPWRKPATAGTPL